MNTTRTSVSTTADFQALYLEVENWISKLLFYTDELKFLQNLLDRYFTELLEHENLDEMRESMMRLQDLKYRCDTLVNRTKKYRNKLTKAEENKELVATENRLPKHQELQDDIANFSKGLNSVKKEIFFLTELVLETKKKKVH